MVDTIYEMMLKGASRADICEKFDINLASLSELSANKLDYDCLSGDAKNKALHTISLLSKRGWDVFDRAPLETQVKLLDLFRRLQHDRSEIQGITKQDVHVDGDIVIKWAGKDPVK